MSTCHFHCSFLHRTPHTIHHLCMSQYSPRRCKYYRKYLSELKGFESRFIKPVIYSLHWAVTAESTILVQIKNNAQFAIYYVKWYLDVMCTMHYSGAHNYFFQKIHETPQNSRRHKKFHTEDLQILGASVKNKKSPRPYGPPEICTTLYESLYFVHFLYTCNCCRVQLKSDCTRWRTGEEVCSQYCSTLPRNTVYTTKLPTIETNDKPPISMVSRELRSKIRQFVSTSPFAYST